MSPGSLLDGDSGINLSIETDSRTAGKKQDHTSNRQFGIFILNFLLLDWLVRAIPTYSVNRVL